MRLGRSQRGRAAPAVKEVNGADTGLGEQAGPQRGRLDAAIGRDDQNVEVRHAGRRSRWSCSWSWRSDSRRDALVVNVGIFSGCTAWQITAGIRPDDVG